MNNDLNQRAAAMSTLYAETVDKAITQASLAHLDQDPKFLESAQVSGVMMALCTRLHRLGFSQEHAHDALQFTLDLVRQMSEGEARK